MGITKMQKYQPIQICSLLQLPKIRDFQFIKGTSEIIRLENMDGKGSILSGLKSRLPRILSGEFNARGGIGYGGAAFDVGKTILIFTDTSGCLVKKEFKNNHPPTPITPRIGSTGAPKISPDENWVLFITEDREIASLEIADTRGFTRPLQLAMGADFYMQAVWHPSNEKIAWVEWDHPFMPWDASRIKIGNLSGMRPKLANEYWIAGSSKNPASQPQFSPDGRYLSFIERDAEWDNLVLYDLENKTRQTILEGEGWHLKMPEWVQGNRSYVWGPRCEKIYHFQYTGPITGLWELDTHTGQNNQIPIDPLTWASQICVSDDDQQLAFIGSSISTPEKIRVLQKKQSRFSFAKLEKTSLPQLECNHFSFQTNNKKNAYGLFFPSLEDPNNKNKKPPLILHIHSGPTSHSGCWFNRNTHYFTSRGFAFAMLNYRGSTGYGYTYQDALRHQWGLVDVQDAVAFTQYLIRNEKVDPARMAIMGSSAGGFTVLNTLIEHPDLFQAGICSYGVSDLLEDAKNTHKFERYYHQFLTGDLKADAQRFIDRSPIHRIGEITKPVLLFHGTNDKVVDITQSQKIYLILQRKGIPSQLVVYEEEGHGFRKNAHIEDFYARIDAFLSEYLN